MDLMKLLYILDFLMDRTVDDHAKQRFLGLAYASCQTVENAIGRQPKEAGEPTP